MGRIREKVLIAIGEPCACGGETPNERQIMLNEFKRVKNKKEIGIYRIVTAFTFVPVPPSTVVTLTFQSPGRTFSGRVAVPVIDVGKTFVSVVGMVDPLALVRGLPSRKAGVVIRRFDGSQDREGKRFHVPLGAGNGAYEISPNPSP